nr:hypothetical protein [Tanacetum cinerariifolium]
QQEKEADDAAETLRKMFGQSTKDLLLQTGAAKASSTNYVNTTSTPVNTAGMFSLNMRSLGEEHVSKQREDKKAKTRLNIEKGNFNKLDDLVGEGADSGVNKGRSTNKIKVLNAKAERVSVAGETLSTATLAVSTVSI